MARTGGGQAEIEPPPTAAATAPLVCDDALTLCALGSGAITIRDKCESDRLFCPVSKRDGDISDKGGPPSWLPDAMPIGDAVSDCLSVGRS